MRRNQLLSPIKRQLRNADIAAQQAHEAERPAIEALRRQQDDFEDILVAHGKLPPSAAAFRRAYDDQRQMYAQIPSKDIILHGNPKARLHVWAADAMRAKSVCPSLQVMLHPIDFAIHKLFMLCPLLDSARPHN